MGGGGRVNKSRHECKHDWKIYIQIAFDKIVNMVKRERKSDIDRLFEEISEVDFEGGVDLTHEVKQKIIFRALWIF